MRGDPIGPPGTRGICGGGSVPVYVEGQGFAGCYSQDESWIIPFLDNASKVATIPADDPAVANFRIISTETTEALKAWNALLERYEAGEATLRELLDFDASALEDNATWKQQYDDLIATESQAPRTWEEIKEILRRNGYSDSEIAQVEKGFHRDNTESGNYCHEGNYDPNNPQGCEFRGNTVLSGILGDLGYDGSWWDVRPIKGTGCASSDSDNPLGAYDDDGNCVPKPETEQPGQPCENGSGIISETGECEPNLAEGTPCDAEEGSGGITEGRRDANGDCISLKEISEKCRVITQENAEECGIDLDNLVECTDNLVTFDDGDGNTVERPVYARSQEDCDNNTNTLFNCGGGIFANSRDECPDVGGVPDCTLEENKDRPECQTEKTDEFQGLYDEFGKDIVDKVKGLYDKIKNKWDRCTDPDNAVECVGELVRTILPGLSEDCKAGGGPGDEWYRDCVTVGVILTIPGIDFPLPGGIGADATLGEIEDALKDAGKSFEDFINDPIGTIKDVFGSIWEKIKDIWNSAEDKTWGNLIKILTDAGFGAIVGILTDRLLDEVVVDSGNPFLPFTPLSCEQADYYAANEKDCKNEGYVDCDSSVDPDTGQQLSGGYRLLKDCEGIVDPQCQDTGIYDDDPNSPTFGKCVCPEGSKYETEDFEEGCGGIVEIDCSLEENKDLPECKEEEIDCSLEENKDLPECKEKVTPPQGDLCEEGELKGKPPQYDFYDLEKNGSYTFGGNKYTYDPCNPSKGPTLVTEGGGDPLECAEITDDNADACGKKKCPDGTFVDKEADCPSGVVVEPGDDGLVVKCDEPKIGYTPTFDYSYKAKWEAYSAEYDATCGTGGGGGGGGGGEVCDNGATVESGCDTCPDGTPVDSYEDGKCPTPVVLPPETNNGGGGGGGSGGGGGGGAFTAEAPEISMSIQGDPTLLAGRSFPITDYLAGLFTGTREDIA